MIYKSFTGSNKKSKIINDSGTTMNILKVTETCSLCGIVVWYMNSIWTQLFNNEWVNHSFLNSSSSLMRIIRLSWNFKDFSICRWITCGGLCFCNSAAFLYPGLNLFSLSLKTGYCKIVALTLLVPSGASMLAADSFY